ncbi:MAG: putative porin [Bacteroidota bacterium]
MGRWKNLKKSHKHLVSLFLLGVGFFYTLHAQFPSQPGLRDRNNSVAYKNPLDTLKTDSLLADIEIKPDVRKIDPTSVFLHLPTYTPVTKSLDQFLKWDELDGEQGFVLSLGQLGKSYQHFQYGLQDQHFADRSRWQNPITQRYNVYARSSESQVPFYDTKTPYVNADFAQGARQFQRVDATVSRNITPNWNVTLFYQGRQVQGAHLEFNTNHTSLFASSHLKSKNERYHLFGNWSLNEMSDDYFGGIVRTLDQDLLVNESEGIYTDNAASLNGNFDKEQANLVLSDANRNATYRQVQIDQFYHLVKPTDSTNFPQELTLRALLRAENNNHRFSDGQISESKLNQHAIPVYPTLDTAITTIREAFKSRSYQALSGLSYSISRPFRFHLDGHVSYKQVELDQDSLGSENLEMFDFQGRGELGFSWGKVRATLHQRATNLFDPQNRLSLEGILFPLIRKAQKENQTEKDSLSIGEPAPPLESPLQITGSFARWGKNPTLFQAHYLPSPGNLYVANPDLENQQFSLWKARISWNPPASIRKGDTLLPSFYYAELFSSRSSDMIFYDSQMNVLQASEALNWFGATIGFRMPILGKTYLESRLTWQRGSTQAEDDFKQYAEYLPEIWGKTSLYYENRSLSIAAILKIGVEITYFSEYQGFGPDLMSGEFFPTSYQVPGYAMADAFFATQIKQAYIFFKLGHVNEGILQDGYYTTPFYPMLERTFSLGISWAFFD